MNKQRLERVDAAFIQIPRADVSHIRRKWLDIAYANTSQAQRLDLYVPDEGDGPFPVIVNIHGGGFEIGDKRDIHLMSMLKGLERRYAVASVNYRLSGKAIFPAGLQAVKAAIRWLRANSEQVQLDGKRIVGPDRFEFDILEGAGHGDPQFETDENLNRVFRFIDRHLG